MFDLSGLKLLYNSRQNIMIRGYEYYRSGAIKEVRLYQKFVNYEVAAVIQDTIQYKTIIKFDQYNSYAGCHCTCAAFHQYGEACKHVAALYSYLNESDKFKKSLNYIAANEFLDDYFSNITVENKHKVTVEYHVQPNPYSGDMFGYLSLRIGIDKLYVVKNLKSFLEQVTSGGVVEFGKKFIFNSKVHDFKEEDKRIIDFLLELYSAEKAIKFESYYAQGSIFNGKNVKMDELLFIKFLKALDGNEFVIQFEDELVENVRADFENYPFDIIIEGNSDNVAVDIRFKEDCRFFRKSDSIIYSGRKLYVMNKMDKSYMLAKAARNNRVNSMEFSNEQRDKILSIIPSLSKNRNIKISPELSANYIEVPLDAGIYLDRYKKGISVKIEFKYGDKVIDPIYKQGVNPYIIRDFEKEEQIINLIDEAGFKVNDNLVHLDDMDRIYMFFRDLVPVLSNISKVYYTDEVKNMYMGRIKTYRSYAHSVQGKNLIDIDVDIEGIDKKEIRDILRSLKEKKKYHKLKGGRIISLEGEMAEDLSNLIERVEIEEIRNNTISLTKYRAVNVFQGLKGSVLSNIENAEQINNIVARIKNYNEENISIPESFKGVLRDYQVTGYKWMKTLQDVGLCGILADDMGLGKTLQAITLMYAAKGQPSIVIAPSSLVYNWESEINKFAPELKSIVISGLRKNREEMLQNSEKYDVIITSYPLIRRDIELYEGIEFKYCILDEAQHIKNPESINAQSVKKINASGRFALTGTPMENSLIELWSVFDFLMPGYLMSKNRFVEKYERPINRDTDVHQLSELKKMVSPFILRRKKKDVLLELPDKIETRLICELTEGQRMLYTAYLAKTKQEIENLIDEEGFEKSRIQILAALTRLRQICCHPSMFIENYTGGSGKVDLLEELLDELIEGQHRILLFSQFTTLLSMLQEIFVVKGIDYMYLDGNTPVEDRMNLVNSFNNGKGNVFLISLKAGGTGLNLTSADTVIHFDPWWNPAVEEQATDRAHRIGQKKVVQVFKLIAKGTIEEKIFKLQNQKKELIDAVIQEGETFINRFSEEELLELLKY